MYGLPGVVSQLSYDRSVTKCLSRTLYLSPSCSIQFQFTSSYLGSFGGWSPWLGGPVITSGSRLHIRGVLGFLYSKPGMHCWFCYYNTVMKYWVGWAPSQMVLSQRLCFSSWFPFAFSTEQLRAQLAKATPNPDVHLKKESEGCHTKRPSRSPHWEGV